MEKLNDFLIKIENHWRMKEKGPKATIYCKYQYKFNVSRDPGPDFSATFIRTIEAKSMTNFNLQLYTNFCWFWMVLGIILESKMMSN